MAITVGGQRDDTPVDLGTCTDGQTEGEARPSRTLTGALASSCDEHHTGSSVRSVASPRCNGVPVRPRRPRPRVGPLHRGGAVRREGGDAQADRSAERAAAVVGGSVVAPLVTPALAAGDRAAQERLGAAVDALVVADLASAVTVRDAEGRVVWSTDAAAIGTTAPLSAAERTALRRASVVPPRTTRQAARSRPPLPTAAGGGTHASGAPAGGGGGHTPPTPPPPPGPARPAGAP